MSTATLARPEDTTRNVIALSWPDVERWLSGKLTGVQRWEGYVELGPAWEPGMHWALCGPTGEGKTTLAKALLALRSYVLALDAKGEDETLASTRYRRVTGVPPGKRFPRDVQKDLDEGKPVRLLVGWRARTDAEDLKLQRLMRDCIAYARMAGHWVVYVDEFELVSSQRMFNLGPAIERMLITARSDGTSVLTSFQAAAWVSKHATRQASFVVMFKTRDRDMIRAVAEAMGRDWRILAQVVDQLPPFHVVIIPKNVRAPMVITKAPK